MSISRAAAAYGKSISDQALTVSNTAVGLTVPAGSVAAMITNGAESVRMRWGTPTASVGHYLNPYSVVDVYEWDLATVKFIRVASDSTIHITYFGEA
jgi:hypothetical protein|tara:strand:- start:1082 stop:1372 length:291 start_codon:yes stop_codon:yes gene_type:complete